MTHEVYSSVKCSVKCQHAIQHAITAFAIGSAMQMTGLVHAIKRSVKLNYNDM